MKPKTSLQEPPIDDSQSNMLLLNSVEIPGKKIAEILGLVQGQFLCYMTTSVIGSAAEFLAYGTAEKLSK